MCDDCKAKFESVPKDLVEALEEHREELVALAQKIGEKIAKNMLDVGVKEDLTPEEAAQGLIDRKQLYDFGGFAAAVGYMLMNNEHERSNLTAYDQLFNSGGEIGFYKMKADAYSRTLN